MKLEWAIIISSIGYILSDDRPIVKLKQGIVEGTHQKSYRNRTFAAFEGIPYAKPPVHNLRFKEPQPADPWDGVLTANKQYACICYLPFPVIRGVRGTEDCLYVYVYVPRDVINENDNFDVVIHIHGGAFMIGSPSMMSKPDYLMDEDVIYVTMNYRLGILGFLSTEDNVVSGNNGLKDQAMALHWIRDNIKSFGGNPDSITLTGLSAGGASVHYHYLSPLSRGLFHRGFSQSGTALNPWALTINPLAKAKVVAKNVSCETDSNEEMIECMRKVPVKNLVLGIRNLVVFLDFIPFTPFGPVIEAGSNPFLSKHPYQLMKEGDVYDVPWITSNVRDEGLMPVGFFVMFGKLKYVDQHWNELMPYGLNIYDTVDDTMKEEVSTKIREHYLEKESLTMENIYNLVQLFSDRMFMVGTELTIRNQAKTMKSPVYYYLSSYVPHANYPFGSIKPGAVHSSDAALLFKLMMNPKVLTQHDEAMMILLTKFIKEYASTGVPKLGGVDWKPLDNSKNELNYLNIESPTKIEMKEMTELAPTKFWDSLPIKENQF